MSLKIYWGSGSPVSWRALLALELKELPYQSHQLQLSEKEHRSEAYLALSPRGTFPILQDGERVVRDSLAILNYLDTKFPERPLFGSDAGEVAEIWRHIGEHESFFGKAVQEITRAFFRKAGVRDAEALGEALKSAYKELALLQELLDSSAFMVGETCSAADIVYYPSVHRLLRAATRPVAQEYGLQAAPLEAYPAVGSWLERMRTLPGVDGTYPPHWR